MTTFLEHRFFQASFELNLAVVSSFSEALLLELLGVAVLNRKYLQEAVYFLLYFPSPSQALYWNTNQKTNDQGNDHVPFKNSKILLGKIFRENFKTLLPMQTFKLCVIQVRCKVMGKTRNCSSN